MDLENSLFLVEEVPSDPIEVVVETTDAILIDPLLDHNYISTRPKTPSGIPRNAKIRQLKALYQCRKCGYITLSREAMQAHSLKHEKTEKPAPKKQCVPCPSCNDKDQILRCRLCNYSTKKNINLKIHMTTHRKKNPIKCTECEHRVETIQELIQHYKTRCHICNCHIAENSGGLTQHLKQCLKNRNK